MALLQMPVQKHVVLGLYGGSTLICSCGQPLTKHEWGSHSSQNSGVGPGILGEGMPSLVIPNCIQVRLRWETSRATIAYNVLTANSASGTQPTQAIANSVGAAIKAGYTSSGLAALAGAGSRLDSVGLRWIGAPNFVEFVDEGAAVLGTAAGSQMPPQVALAITLRTSQAGKSFRGRIFLPNFADVAGDGSGAATAATVLAATTFVNDISTALSSSGYTLSVGSRERLADPTHVPPITFKPAFSTPVTAIVSRDVAFETQRRRVK
jgi:hypothetical protein